MKKLNKEDIELRPREYGYFIRLEDAVKCAKENDAKVIKAKKELFRKFLPEGGIMTDVYLVISK